MSVLAILSLVFSVICCLPGLSSIGSVLGVFALIGIAKSGGRVRGTGLAIAGIIIGLLVSIGWIGLAIGTNRGVAIFAQRDAIIQDIIARDAAAVRGALNPDSAAAFDEQTLGPFSDRLTEQGKEFQGIPESISGMLSSVAGIVENEAQLSQAITVIDSLYGENAQPVPVEFADGIGIMLFITSDSLSRQQRNVYDINMPLPQLENLAIITPEGELYWLVEIESTASNASPGSDEDTAADGQPPADDPESDTATGDGG